MIEWLIVYAGAGLVGLVLAYLNRMRLLYKRITLIVACAGVTVLALMLTNVGAELANAKPADWRLAPLVFSALYLSLRKMRPPRVETYRTGRTIVTGALLTLVVSLSLAPAALAQDNPGIGRDPFGMTTRERLRLESEQQIAAIEAEAEAEARRIEAAKAQALAAAETEMERVKQQQFATQAEADQAIAEAEARWAARQAEIESLAAQQIEGIRSTASVEIARITGDSSVAIAEIDAGLGMARIEATDDRLMLGALVAVVISALVVVGMMARRPMPYAPGPAWSVLPPADRQLPAPHWVLLAAQAEGLDAENIDGQWYAVNHADGVKYPIVRKS